MINITMDRQDIFASNSIDITSVTLRPVHGKIIVTDGDSAKKGLAKLPNSAQHEVDKTNPLMHFVRKGRFIDLARGRLMYILKPAMTAR